MVRTFGTANSGRYGVSGSSMTSGTTTLGNSGALAFSSGTALRGKGGSIYLKTGSGDSSNGGVYFLKLKQPEMHLVVVKFG